MSSVSPISSESRSGDSKATIRHNEWHSLDAEEAIPIPPSVLPPTPPTPPSPPPSSSSNSHSLLTPNTKESARFSTDPSSAYRSKILSSTPYPPSSRVARKSVPNRRASPFPLLIPTELTLSIVRESPLTAVEELTCGDHVDGKEDSVSSTRPAEASAAITERQCVAYGTPRETSVAAAAVGATAATASTAGIATVEEIPKPKQHTMGACTSKKSSSSSKNSDKSLQTTKPEKPAKTNHAEADDVNDEEDPAQLPKFKLKRDSIAVTKVRMMKTQIHQENTIGEEEEDDDDDEQDDSGRGEDHVHFDNHVSKQSIPNDSGVSLNSCPDNDDDDHSSIKFDGKLECDSRNEISLASNVTIRSLRKEKIVEDENRGFDFKTIRERTKQLLESRMEQKSGGLQRNSLCKKD